MLTIQLFKKLTYSTIKKMIDYENNHNSILPSHGINGFPTDKRK